MTKYFGLALAIGLLSAWPGAAQTVDAQTGNQNQPAAVSGNTTNSSNEADLAQNSSSTKSSDADRAETESNNAQTSNDVSKAEGSIFTSLFMAGKTQDQFEPETPESRLVLYGKDLFGPFHLMLAGLSAGIAQAENVPHQWGQGAAGYFHRYGNYYAYAGVSSVLQMCGEDLLHEDNLYYGSGEHGIWRRVKYAVKSSVLARGADGTQHFSISQVGSTAGAAFISRLWQPKGNNSASDGATSFGISLASNAGINVVREFLPDITKHLFRRGANN